MLTNITLLSLIVVLGVFVAVIYFELQKLKEQTQVLRKDINYLIGEIDYLKRQAKKKYYSKSNNSNSNSSKKQVIHG
jgi:cell division protein FtsB